MPHKIFINLNLSKKIKKRLIKLIDFIKKSNPNFKSSENSLHCTFVFIGDELNNKEEILQDLSNINNLGIIDKIKLLECSILSRQTVVLIDVPEEWKKKQIDINSKYGTSQHEWQPHITIGRGGIPNIPSIETEYSLKFELNLRRGKELLQ